MIIQGGIRYTGIRTQGKRQVYRPVGMLQQTRTMCDRSIEHERSTHSLLLGGFQQRGTDGESPRSSSAPPRVMSETLRVMNWNSWSHRTAKSESLRMSRRTTRRMPPSPHGLLQRHSIMLLHSAAASGRTMIGKSVDQCDSRGGSVNGSPFA